VKYLRPTKIVPSEFIRELVKHSEYLHRRIEWDATERPPYAYGTYYSALQARALGISKISSIEFGVAGGNGLIALEKIAKEVSEYTSVQVDVYGFDTGVGLPQSVDYRDLPYAYKRGFYKMDAELLNKKLKTATLILGDVADTVVKFIKEHKPSPVGFVAFDLDYYSSTVAALRLFDTDQSFILPRTYCYFDDTVGDDFDIHSHYTGELLAIEEFNHNHHNMKLAKIHGLSYKRHIPDVWNEQMYVLHVFDHKLYKSFIKPHEKDYQKYGSLLDVGDMLNNKKESASAN